MTDREKLGMLCQCMGISIYPATTGLYLKSPHYLRMTDDSGPLSDNAVSHLFYFVDHTRALMALGKAVPL